MAIPPLDLGNFCIPPPSQNEEKSKILHHAIIHPRPPVTGSPLKKPRPENCRYPLFDALVHKDYRTLGEPEQAVLNFCQTAARHFKRGPENPLGPSLLSFIARYIQDKGQGLPQTFFENLFLGIAAALYPAANFKGLAPPLPFAINENCEEWNVFLVKLLENPHYKCFCEQGQIVEVLKGWKLISPILLSPFCKVYLNHFEQISPELQNALAPLCIAFFPLFYETVVAALKGKMGGGDLVNEATCWIVNIFDACSTEELQSLIPRFFELTLFKHLYKSVIEQFVATALVAPLDSAENGKKALTAFLLITPLVVTYADWFNQLGKVLPRACCYDPKTVFKGLSAIVRPYLISDLLLQMPVPNAEQVVIHLRKELLAADPAAYRELAVSFQDKEATVAALLFLPLAAKGEDFAWKELGYLLPVIAIRDQDWAYNFCLDLSPEKSDVRMAPLLSNCLNVIETQDPRWQHWLQRLNDTPSQ